MTCIPIEHVKTKSMGEIPFVNLFLKLEKLVNVFEEGRNLWPEMEQLGHFTLNLLL